MTKYEFIISCGELKLCVEVIGETYLRNVLKIAQAINHGKATAYLTVIDQQRKQLMEAFNEPEDS